MRGLALPVPWGVFQDNTFPQNLVENVEQTPTQQVGRQLLVPPVQVILLQVLVHIAAIVPLGNTGIAEVATAAFQATTVQ